MVARRPTRPPASAVYPHITLPPTTSFCLLPTRNHPARAQRAGRRAQAALAEFDANGMRFPRGTYRIVRLERDGVCEVRGRKGVKEERERVRESERERESERREI